jgi:tRNA(Ile)-lysidine synthase
VPPTSANELSADQVARFARDVAALADPDDRVLVAVSGGPDSVALLLLAHAALGDRCRAATVDHGLRAESADEAEWVAALCAQRGIDHSILVAPLPDRAGRTANVSARARTLRYRLLEEHAARIGAQRIATAHHADDQLETLIMRLNRGAGVAGLAGIRAKGGRIVRPLLGWRRAELAAIVAAQGIVPIDDPSNVSDRFDRARLRKALAGVDWLDADRFGTSASALSDAEDAIAWTVRRLEAQQVETGDDGITFWPDDLPFELRRRLVECCLQRLDPDADLRGPALVRFVNTLESGERAMLGDTIGTAHATSDGRVAWRFRMAPPRRSR